MKNIIFTLALLLTSLSLSAEVIIDSNTTLAEALVGTEAPIEITSRVVLVDVEYYSDDEMLHRGQIIVDSMVKSDIVEIFRYIKELRIPIKMVIPVKFDLPNGNTTMAGLNNTYGFHYRKIVGSERLSNHSYGRAIDINPFDNPYISSTGTVVPQGGEYSPSTNPRSLSKDSKLVQKFIELGWIWGGNWDTPKDYMHFEKK